MITASPCVMVALKKLWNTYSFLTPSAVGAEDSYILSGTTA
jgi:hypothetical protein